MTAIELHAMIGRSGIFNVPVEGTDAAGFLIPVRVVDARQQYGRVDIKVEPIHGAGSTWVPLKNRSGKSLVTLDDVPVKETANAKS